MTANKDFSQEPIASELFGNGPNQNDRSRRTPLEDGFREIQVPKNSSERPTPSVASVIDRLHQTRMIVIGGLVRDKNQLARHSAVLIPDVNPMEGVGTDISLDYLEKETRPTVFVIPNVDGNWFHRSRPILNRVVEHHLIILTTELPLQSWHGTDINNFWLEVDESELYLRGDLTNYFSHQFNKRDFRKSDFHTRAWNLIVSQAGFATLDETVEHIVERLGSPDAIDAFIQDFSNLNDDSGVDLDQLIQNAKDDCRTAKEWFELSLGKREQTAALGMALLHGMDEPTGFKLMDNLMEGAWSNREDSSRLFDYNDLTNLRQFFVLNDAEGDAANMFCKRDDIRATILQAAWSTHRRQILAALTFLNEAVLTASRANEPYITRLKNIVGETFGEISMISLKAAEPYLWKLVASNDQNGHGVVARALRRMRRERGADAVFELIKRWQSDGNFWIILGRLTEDKSTEGLGDLVSSAVVIIMAELAMEEVIGGLSQDILHMITGFASASDTVFDCYCKVAIPSLARYHTNQMLSLLDNLLREVGTNAKRNHNFASGFGFGLGMAINDGSTSVWDILAEWIEQNLYSPAGGFDKELVSIREQRIAIALNGISVIKPSPLSTANTARNQSPRKAYELISKVLKRERHPFVRNAAFLGVIRLTWHEFPEVKEGIKETLGIFTKEERKSFINWLVELHCAQRQDQGVGDTWIAVQGPLSRNWYNCPVWHNKDPENTPVLKSLFAWSAETVAPEVSAFASDTLLEVRRVIERSQERKQSDIIERRAREEERLSELAKTEAPKLDLHETALSFLQRYATIPAATFLRPDLRSSVIGIFDSLTRCSKPEEATEIIQRLDKEAADRGSTTAEGKRLADVVKAVRMAWSLNQYMTAIVAVGILATVGLILLLSAKMR